MHSCAVFSCNSSSSSKSVKLFRVPVGNKDDTRGWLHFITEANSGVIPCSAPRFLFVCSKHFRKCCLYPQQTRVIAGHYPSVLDGKVVTNENSKCALISAEENLQTYMRPKTSSCSQREKQRAYLVHKLTSFSVQRKIVIGGGNSNFGCVPKTSPPNIVPNVSGCPDECSKKAAASSTVSPRNANLATSEESGNKKRKMDEPHPALNPEVTVKVEAAKPEKRSKCTRHSQICRPSTETKVKLLSRDKINLKKSVSALEKRVKETEKEVKMFRAFSTDIELRYNKLQQLFEQRLQQNKRRKASKIEKKVTRVQTCKCASITLVDISED